MWRYIDDGDDYASDDDEDEDENENVEEEADDNDVEEVDDVDDDVDDDNQVLHPINAQCRVAIGSSVYCPMGSYLPTPVTAGSSEYKTTSATVYMFV